MNQRDKTLRCIRSLREVTRPAYKILLWDNGSKDGTCDVVKQYYPDIIIHHHPENIGVASGRNRAAHMAIELVNPAFLLFIDNDMIVDPAFLELLVSPFEDNVKLAQTTAKILDINNQSRIYGAGGCRIQFWRGNTMHLGYGQLDKGQYNEFRKCYPSGGCMLVRTDIFKKLGGFDSVFDPYGPEDLDFGLRVEKAGYYGLYVPDSIVYHETKPGKTFEGGKYTEVYASHRAKHWLLFMKRHAPLWEKIVFMIVTAPVLFFRVMSREMRRGNMAAVKGLFEGALQYFKSQVNFKK